MPPRRLPGQPRSDPTTWDPNPAMESLKAPMPSRTNPKNAAIICNIDKHPSLATLPVSPDAQTLVHASVPTQLAADLDPHKNQYVVRILHIYVLPTDFLKADGLE